MPLAAQFSILVAWDRRGTGFVAQFRCYLRSGFVFGEEKVVHGGWD